MNFLEWLRQALITSCGVDYEPLDTASITSALDWMEQSAVGVCVAQSGSGYYVMLSLHAMGLAMVVGIVVMLDLWVLGLMRGIKAQAAAGLVRFAWVGLAINALSGLALFFSEANKAFYSISFRIKIALMLLGVISTLVLNKTVFQPALSAVAPLPSHAKSQARLSIALWLSVIVVGRLMSYFTAPAAG
jgi:hypothetical protein